jgi:DNA helicase-2/ATP-dependent DNA helicase PcrA
MECPAPVSPLLDDLTESQARAVEHFEGPLLVLAGPGSGKTRVVTRRIARLIERRVHPSEILAITFTNKAAKEMGERVEHLIPGVKVAVGTFHRFCAKLLRQYGGAVGLKPNYSILDVKDQDSALKEAVKEEGFDPTHYSPSRIGWRIGQLKNECLTPAMFAEQTSERIGSHLDAVVAKAYGRYQKILLEANAVDFDDLLMHVVTLLKENPHLRQSLDERYRFILVDEYQDTNRAQYQIISALSQNEPNLCATGDPDQSIYGWRGAQIENILRFERDYPRVEIVRLQDNFRSTPEILAAADELIQHNTQRKAKQLFTANPSGPPVVIRRYADGYHEADSIAAEIRERVASGERQYSDFAIFYRVNSLSRSIETALGRARVPFSITGGVAFYERTEVKDLISYLRLIENPDDRPAFRRIVNTPVRGIGKNSQDKLDRWAQAKGLNLWNAVHQVDSSAGLPKKAEYALKLFAALLDELANRSHGPIAELLEVIVERTGYATNLRGLEPEESVNRLANIGELIASARQYDSDSNNSGSLGDFLETCSLVQEADAIDATAGEVHLMSLHAAKGLEFPCVYLIGVEHGLLPHDRALRDGDPLQIEEERRLLFVGITRAREELCLTWTRMRTTHGRPLSAIASQFLSEISAEHQDFSEDDTSFGDWSPQEVRGGSSGDSILAQLAGLSAPKPTISPEEETEDEPQESPETLATPSAPTFMDQVLQSSPVGSGEPADSPGAQPRSRLSRSKKGERVPEAVRHEQLKSRLMTGADLMARDELSNRFQLGMQVRHPEYGRGRVIGLSIANNRPTVRVEFESSGEEKDFIASMAPLQPLR